MTEAVSDDNAQDTIGDSSPESAGTLTSSERLARANPPQSVAELAVAHMAPTSNDDDASDVSMSAETEDSDDENRDGHHGASLIITQPHPTQYTEVTGDIADLSRKRKFLSDEENTHFTQAQKMDDRKRIKLDLSCDVSLKAYRTGDDRLPANRSLLPAEIWHHIFSFTPPRALGRLLQVNKIFRAYLDSSYSPPSPNLATLSQSVARILCPEAVWQNSRRTFRHAMPSPLQNHSELEMWKLACTPRCQFCDRRGQALTPSTDKWHPGPGENGVSPVWPFAIRTCGSCLQEHSTKEIDLFLSSSIPGPLISALPFVFLTNDLHVLSSVTLQSDQPPSNVQLTKYYFKPHVDAIKSDFFRVKSMGSGTAEEWLKGLDETGKERRNDAARWERWDVSGGVRRMHINESLEVQDLFQRFKTSIGGSAQNSLPKPLHNVNLPNIPIGGNNYIPPAPGTLSSQLVQTTNAPFSNITPPHRFDSPAQNGVSPYPLRTFQNQRQERTKEEVAELKAARRSEIERRCLQLEPPIPPSVLSHMGSFQAAIQIIKPLDDNAWEVLKPRLLSQRDDAVQRESDRIAQTRIVQERFDERLLQDVQGKETKEVVDKEWEDLQMPVRTRIGGYADEIIRDGWDGGAKVSKDSCPSFAADVLIYVRKRFYAEVAKDEAAARAAGQEPKTDPPHGPFTQKLILENMKWVFDIKIKPHTEQYRKELFLCNGCDGNFKFYGFEGVIQHYAAKHTSSLSLGSIVVHWRAEWPEHPPFNPDPLTGKPSFYPPPVSTPAHPSVTTTMPQTFGYGGYPATSGQAPASILTQQHPAGYHQSPGPYFGHPQFGDQYQGTQNGPFAPPSNYQAQQQGFPGPNYQNSQVNSYQAYQGQGYPAHNFDGSYPNTNPSGFESPHPSQVYPVAVADQAGNYPQMAFQPPVQYNPGLYNAAPAAGAIQRTEEYLAQLQDVAKNARELWNHTSGVKDMPGSVRVYVILYHVLLRSREKFPDDPPLSMLIDGLSNNKEMRPVRNVNGLVCRACNLEKAKGVTHSGSKAHGTTEKKYLSLPQLLNHFQTTHIDEMQTQQYDWTQDMVELPDNEKVALVANAHGMDDYKRKLLFEAIPNAFSRPVVRSEPIYEELAPSQDDHLKYYSKPRSQTPDGGRGSYQDYNTTVPQNAPLRVTSSIRPHYEVSRIDYHEQVPVTYIERRAASPAEQTRDEYFRPSYRKDDHMYSEPSRHYRDADQRSHVSRGTEVVVYDDVPRNERGYRADVPLARLLEEREEMATTATDARGQEIVVVQGDHNHRQRGITPSRPVSVAGPPSRSQQPSRAEPLEGGSEDGELRVQLSSKPDSRNNPASIEAQTAAERFLNEFQPGENIEEYTQKAEEAERRNEEALRTMWESERVDSMRQMRQPGQDEERGSREKRNFEDGRVVSLGRSRLPDEMIPSAVQNRVPYERTPVLPRQQVVYDYEDRYVGSERYIGHERSPEMVDQLYTVSNAAQRDDRPITYAAPAPTGRYAQYENVRLGHDRPGRSRSPVYVKLGSHPSQYREQSPGPRYVHQEPIYRARTPQQQLEEIQYERVPRPEYYRVYADGPRRASSRYDGQVEYVQVADSQGDYVIRRPVRRDAEPLYATYEDGTYAREPVHEIRAPVSRSDPAYYEEYDPRNPAPPPTTGVRQVRYQ